MNNLFKVILLCAILSNTFTPCFSEDFSASAAEELAHLEPAVPAEIAKEKRANNDNLPTAQSDLTYNKTNSTISLIDNADADTLAACPVANDIFTHRSGTVEAFKSAYKCLADKELTAVKLEKGRTFEVKSLQAMSSKSSSGTEVKFETIYPEKVMISKDPMKLIFIGEVIKNKPPGKGGSSAALKVQIKNVKLENITYPAIAYISKMNRKGVFFGFIGGKSNYMDNLADTANNGTINNIYKDPCHLTEDGCVSVVVKPVYYTAGALLQLADLLFSPVAAFFVPGNEVDIPEGTEFEIKIEDDIPILEI